MSIPKAPRGGSRGVRNVIIGASILFGGGLLYGAYRLTQINFNKNPNQRRHKQVDPQLIAPLDRTVRSPNPAQRVIVGRCTVPGVVCFVDSTGPYMSQLFLLANHEINDVLAVVIDGREYYTDEYGYVTSAPFTQRVFTHYEGGSRARPQFEDRRYLRLNARLGTPLQLADVVIRNRHPEVFSDFRQLGHATVSMEAFRGQTETADMREYRETHGLPHETERVWGSSGFPSDPKFVVEGLKCYDPRRGEDPNDRVFTRNSALIMAQILLNKSLVRGVGPEDIDYELVKRSADACDLGFEIGPKRQYPRGAIFPRYTLDGVIQTTEDMINVLESMLLCSRTVLGWQQDSYKIDTIRRRNAVETVTDSDVIGRFKFKVEKIQADRIDTVRATYRNDDADGNTTEAPPQSVLDAGEPATNDVVLSLPYLSGTYRAQYVMRQSLYDFQLERRLEDFVIGKKAGAYEVGDVINVDLARAPVVNGEYVIEEIGIGPDAYTFTCNLSEYDIEMVDRWDAGDETEDELIRIEHPRISVVENVITEILRQIP